MNFNLSQEFNMNTYLLTGKSVCTIVTLVNWKWFEDWKDKKLNKRGADYDALKNYIGQRLWDNVAKMYPQLEDKVRKRHDPL